MQSRNSTALIFGISGQDGAYLAARLLNNGLEVHGTSRDKDASSFAGLKTLGIAEKVSLHSASMTDFHSVATIIRAVRPRYIYNLAAQSSVGLSFEQPVSTINSVMVGTINVMEAVRFLELDARFYNAASSECFGNTETPADETSQFRPRSPYAVAKASAFWAVSNYREAYGLYACSGLLFNHESPLRPNRYVTQKIVRGALDVAEGMADTLELGALDVSRDWGWAPEYVDAMERMLQLAKPVDFVIATGESHSLEDFVAATFRAVDRDWRDHVRLNPAYCRPTDIKVSRGNPSRASQLLGWEATVRMPSIIDRLIDAERSRRQRH